MQWGYKQIGVDTATSISVSYPLQDVFTNPPIVTGILKTSALDNNNTRRLFQIYNVGVNSFTAYGNTSKTFGINWIAIGY